MASRVPEDSIMDMVDNIEGLYNMKIAAFDRWMQREQGESPTASKVRNHGRAMFLARSFANDLVGTVTGRYRVADIRQAAEEILDDYEEYKQYIADHGRR